MRHSLVSMLLVCPACGGGALDPGSGNSAGDGTGTLLVDGSAHAEPLIANAASPRDFNTEFVVRVTLADQVVTTGTVTMTGNSGATELAFVPDGELAGRWRGVASGYDEVYILDVDTGTDNVSGVRVDGPDVHVFTTPLPGDTVDSLQPLDITWDCDDAADEITLRAGEVGELAITDQRQFTLPAGSLQNEADKTRENELRLERANRVTPSGGVVGSDMRVSVRQEITILAAPTGL